MHFRSLTLCGSDLRGQAACWTTVDQIIYYADLDKVNLEFDTVTVSTNLSNSC